MGEERNAQDATRGRADAEEGKLDDLEHEDAEDQSADQRHDAEHPAVRPLDHVEDVGDGQEQRDCTDAEPRQEEHPLKHPAGTINTPTHASFLRF